MVMTVTSVWLPKEILKTAKKHQLNLSQILKAGVKTQLKDLGVEVKEKMPELIIKVKCPYCSHTQNTTTIKRVRCFKCERTFSIYRKGKPSRIVEIVKGSRDLLFKYYNAVYKKD